MKRSGRAPAQREDEILYQAVLTRDPRFDGKFFVGVITTGVYCRPICPARPKRENLKFFPSAPEAEKAGFRPCLRCRPESAPQSPAWIGRSSTVRRALQLLATQENLGNEDAFAERLGVSARHLRRLFEEELGQTPKRIFDSHRLDFARKLLVETSLPVTDVAGTAGFASIRRFNDAFKSRFHRSPREIRQRQSMSRSDGLELSLAYRPPFDWDALLHFYRSHVITGVESVTDDEYCRVLPAGGAFAVRHDPEKHRLLLRVHLEGKGDLRSLHGLVRQVRQMFDLDSDPIVIAGAFDGCRVLSRLVARHPGLRLTRGWDPFESAVCTILGQLVSTEQAVRLVAQLVTHYGSPVSNPVTDQAAFLFPTPSTLATASLTEIGTTQARKNAIREFSRAVVEGKVSLNPAQDGEAFRESLLAVPGIGPWSAEYICLRALGDTDAFPGSDLILKRALGAHPELRLEEHRPWRGYAALLLWKEYAGKLSKKGPKKHTPKKR